MRRSSAPAHRPLLTRLSSNATIAIFTLLKHFPHLTTSTLSQPQTQNGTISRRTLATNDSVVASALIAVGGLAALLAIEFYIRFLVAVGKWLKIDRMIEAASDLSLQFWVSIAIVGVLVLPLLLASNLYVAVWIKERLEWNVTSGSSAALLLNWIALGGLAGVVAVVVRMLLKYLRLVSDLSWYLVYGGDSYESLKKI